MEWFLIAVLVLVFVERALDVSSTTSTTPVTPTTPVIPVTPTTPVTPEEVTLLDRVAANYITEDSFSLTTNPFQQTHVSLSFDGNVLAISEYSTGASIKIYYYDGANWNLGLSDSDSTGGHFAQATQNGDRVFTVAYDNPNHYLRLYQRSGNSWSTLGGDLLLAANINPSFVSAAETGRVFAFNNPNNNTLYIYEAEDSVFSESASFTDEFAVKSFSLSSKHHFSNNGVTLGVINRYTYEVIILTKSGGTWTETVSVPISVGSIVNSSSINRFALNVDGNSFVIQRFFDSSLGSEIFRKNEEGTYELELSITKSEHVALK